MLRLYKDLAFQYFTVSILGSLFILINGDFHWIAILLTLIWILVCAIFSIRAANRRIQSIQSMRVDECRLMDTVQEYEKLLTKAKTSSISSILKLYTATAYVEAGQAQKGLELLKSIQLKENKKDIQYHFYAMNTKITAYIQLKEFEQAEKELEEYKKLFDHPLITPKLKNNYFDFYERRCMDLKVEKKEINDDIIQYYQKLITTEQQLLKKVYGHYYLALAYEFRNDKEKAKSCYEYALENGNDTYYASEARKRLNEY